MKMKPTHENNSPITNRLNDAAYFESLKTKMMQYAKENPIEQKKPFRLSKLWAAAAAIALLATGVFIFNQVKRTESIENMTYTDTLNQTKQTILNENIEATNSTENTISYTLKPIIIKDELLKTVSLETIEQQVLSDNMDEDELLEMLPEDDLDNWMAEYQVEI